MSVPLDLDLRAIDECSGLTANVLGALREAAEVVLHRFHGARETTVAAQVEHGQSSPRAGRLQWGEPDERAKATHANDNNASEDGACAVAILGVHRALGFRVVRRAVHQSGADYLMLREGEDGERFVRLEVSGILGVASAVSRLREKVEELRNGKDRRPGVAAVVVFPKEPVRLLFQDVPEVTP